METSIRGTFTSKILEAVGRSVVSLTGRSGFHPDYAEYTIAMTNPSHSEEWRKVLTEQVLASCSKERVEAERVATKTFI